MSSDCSGGRRAVKGREGRRRRWVCGQRLRCSVETAACGVHKTEMRLSVRGCVPILLQGLAHC